jgi:hypothetical protein
LFTEANMMMARCFENGFHLVDRCRRDLPALAGFYPEDSAMRAALAELLEAAGRIDSLLRRSNAPAAASWEEQC